MMGLPWVASVRGKPEKGRLSTKGGKGKTCRIHIKWVDQKRSKLMPKIASRRRFRSRPITFREVRKFQKSTITSNTEDAFLEASKRNNTEGPWKPLHPSGDNTGTAQGCRGLFNMITGGHKPLCYSHKMHDDTTMGYKAG